MSVISENPVLGQIEVEYSDQRKYEMAAYGQKDCHALFALLKDIIEENDSTVEKVIIPHESNRGIDMILEVKSPNEYAFRALKSEMNKIIEKHVGAKRISTELIDE